MLRFELHRRSQELRCPYCRDGLSDQGAESCGGCGTVLHAACVGELSSCPTLGCEGLGLEALRLPSCVEARDRAEVFLAQVEPEPASAERASAEARDRAEARWRRAQAGADPAREEQALRAYLAARETYRVWAQAQVRARGAELDATVPTCSPRGRTIPRPERWELPEGWRTVAVLIFGLLLCDLRLSSHVLPFWGSLFAAAGVVLACWVVLKTLCGIRNTWVEGAPYR